MNSSTSQDKSLAQPNEMDWLRLLRRYAQKERQRQLESAHDLAEMVYAINDLLGDKPTDSTIAPLESSPKAEQQATATVASTSSKAVRDVAQLSSQPSQSVQVTSSTEELKARDGTSLASIVKTKDGYVINVKVNVTESTGSWKNFLVGGSKRILPAVAEKRRGFFYAPIFEKGVLTRLELSGVDEGLWKEVRAPIAWALDRAREERQ